MIDDNVKQAHFVRNKNKNITSNQKK